LLDEYAHLREDFRQTTRQLAALPLEPGWQETLERLADRESRLHKLLTAPERGPQVADELADGYAKLVDGAQSMLAATNQLTQRAIERLQETATQGREKWIYVGIATVGIAIALAIVFATLIARPIRQLDLAIRQMGSADFTHAIKVTGPQDLRYVGQRLDWLRGRLSDLEQQQARFLRHVSHELKTPLTAVREGAELLRDDVGGKLTPEQRDIVRIVRDNTLSLQKLIEDLLAYQQTRAMEPAVLGPVALPDVVTRVVKEQRLAALARMVTFEANLRPATVIGDAEKLRTIVDNLLSNAIKYSPRNGSVELTVGVKDGLAVFDVIDEGRGVVAADRSRIFESFYRGPPPVDGRIKGSGLGLAIAREYALAQGGRIEVTGRRDGKSGAWFRLSLPLAATELSRKRAPAPATELASK
jgi:two-component system, NtrC family, sensor histidine kinase GlrK